MVTGLISLAEPSLEMYGDDEHRRFGIPQQRNEALDRQTPQDLLPIGARKIRDGAPVARTHPVVSFI